MRAVFDVMLLVGVLAWFLAARAAVAWAVTPLRNALVKGAVPGTPAGAAPVDVDEKEAR